MKFFETTNVQGQDNAPLSANGLRGIGIFFLVLGIVAIVSAFAATLATVLVFGVILLLAGIAQLAHAFSERHVDFGWRLTGGILYTLVGVLLIADPVGGAIGLTLLLAVLFLVGGALRIGLATSMRRQGRAAGWQIAGGVINLVLAGLIIAGWPGTASWIIGLFVGIELFFGGLTLVFAPEAVRRNSPV